MNNTDIILIAEIGWNFLGDMELARNMIKYASNSGATYTKFQTWSVDRLKPGEWDNDGRREIYEKAQLSKQDHIDLIDSCKVHNVRFLSSVFSIPDAELLVELGVNDVKIPSFESRNKELIEYCCSNFNRVFLSTGTSTVSEIGSSIENIDNNCELFLLHCVSSYPGKHNEANIKRMELLKKFGYPVGYSDHIQGIDSAKVAIGFGACVIEKHFTIDNGLPGRDNKFAILPREMGRLKKYVDIRKEMMVPHGGGYQSCEENQRHNYTGRFNG